MKSQFDTWLRECAAGGLGGIDWVLPPITPGFAWTHTMTIDADVSADTFSGDVRLNPDADATPLETIAVSAGAYADGVTPLTFLLTAAHVATITAAASDGDGDGVSEAVVYLFHTPAGDDEYRLAATNIEILQ
jgi:hypothetical protein